jgi:UPF0755 protein
VARRARREAAITARRSPGRRGCLDLIQSLGIIVLFAVLLSFGGAYFFYRALRSPYKGYNQPQVQVEVKKGVRTDSILRHLRNAGVLRDEFIPLIYLKVVRHGELLKAGIYEFDKPLSAVDVLEKIIRGDVILRSVTIREGLDRFAVAQLMVSEGFGWIRDWNRLTADPEQIRDIDPEATTLEGYLFPDTYKLTPGTPPSAIVQALTQNFRKHFGGEINYISTGLTLHDTITLASIVETEAKLPQERHLVASVYLNRYRMGMPLQADPTVIYALKLASRWAGKIHHDDLAIDSPYNTYRVHGFPPGPIASPGIASLRAAASPARTAFLYFVARNDGSHAFSTNLVDHNRNVQIYQKPLWRNARATQ